MSDEKEILIGLTGIATRFRVSRGTVRAWYAQGAPIIRMGTRTYRAFYENVVAWLESQAQGEWNVRSKNS
nr:MAG TPA: Pyocin activator protein PrtN [Caudoviricetes sp.]